MIRSMTGFGDASAEVAGVHYFVEVRSLNSRYFKAVIRLPEDLQGLEAELESELRRRLNRGTVTLTAHLAETGASAAREINAEALGRYIDQLRRVPHAEAGEVKIDLAALLTLPGVLKPKTDEEQRLDSARKVLLDLVARACEGVLAMRAREGSSLLEDLLSQRDVIASRLEVIRQRAPAVIAEYENRLRSRLEAMLTEAQIRFEAVDLVREIAVYAERTDVAEEISRLGAHVQQFTELVSGDGCKPVGRTLDFLAQEMLREANTIGSKSGDAEISRAIVEVKGAIDRIKEQVQNAE